MAKTGCKWTTAAVTDLGRFEAETFLEMFENERDEDVESFADGLEHDEVERNAGERVEHAEHLAAGGLRRAVSVPCHNDDSPYVRG